MGVDRKRFVGLGTQFADELTCGICMDILAAPIVTVCCGQSYCRQCMSAVMISGHKVCPNCRRAMNARSLQSAPKALVNLLSLLYMSCEYAAQGCRHLCPQQQMAKHVRGCGRKMNPNPQNGKDMVILDIMDAKQFVNLSEDMKRLISCGRCGLIAQEPVSLDTAPELYCKMCCTPEETVIPSTHVTAIINTWEVRCRFEPLGCAHTCVLSDLAKHMDTECQHNPNRQCGKCLVLLEGNEGHDCLALLFKRFKRIETTLVLANYPRLETPVSMDISIPGRSNQSQNN